MLSSPYPVPQDAVWRGLLILGWVFGVIGGGWVLYYPPVTYQGIGLGLTIAWGVMLAAGALAILIAHLRQSYRIEIPGLWLVVGGLIIYILLSWDQVFSGSWGSGPRACLLVTLACICAARLRVLHILDRRLRRIDSYGRG